MVGFEMLFCFEFADGGAPRMPSTPEAEVSAALGVSEATFLGSGSFGETWRVPPAMSGGPERAVKIIIEPTYPAALLDREVAGLERMDHPRIVRLLGREEITLQAGQRQCLVFEYVAGGDLSEKLCATPLTPAETHRFAVAVLDAITAMHAEGTVHRDIKPQNIALRGGDVGDPVLLDLGLARLLTGDSMTQYPQPIGTRAYMAPEQVRGERAGKQSDVWALGVVLYVMLSGRHPFFGPRSAPLSIEQALTAFEVGPPPLTASLPEALRGSVMTMLSAAPYARGSARRHLRALHTLRGTDQ